MPTHETLHYLHVTGWNV